MRSRTYKTRIEKPVFALSSTMRCLDLDFAPSVHKPASKRTARMTERREVGTVANKSILDVRQSTNFKQRCLLAFLGNEVSSGKIAVNPAKKLESNGIAPYGEYKSAHSNKVLDFR